MSDTPKPWTMPDWMRKLEPYFNDAGGASVETLMNTYGAKCGNRLAGADLETRAMIVNAQVGLLVALQAAGKLGGGGPAIDMAGLADAVDDKFVVPMALYRTGSETHRAFEFLRQEVAAIFKEAGVAK